MKEVIVYMIFNKKEDEQEVIGFHVNRPAFLSDEELTKEAHKIAKDLKKRNYTLLKDLVEIYLARTDSQKEEMEQKFKHQNMA